MGRTMAEALMEEATRKAEVSVRRTTLLDILRSKRPSIIIRPEIVTALNEFAC